MFANFPELVIEMRRQLFLNQEDMASKLGAIFAIINRWETRKATLTILAHTQFSPVCKEMLEKVSLKLSGGGNGES